MPGRVGDDEFALGRREVTVSHINGDALFALGFQTIGQQRQINPFFTAPLGGGSNCFELIFKNGFTVE